MSKLVRTANGIKYVGSYYVGSDGLLKRDIKTPSQTWSINIDRIEARSHTYKSICDSILTDNDDDFITGNPQNNDEWLKIKLI